MSALGCTPASARTARTATSVRFMLPAPVEIACERLPDPGHSVTVKAKGKRQKGKSG
jgi:hypothetical protein